jgi:hypothetical protein
MLLVDGLFSKEGEIVTFDVYEEDPGLGSLNDDEIGSFDSIAPVSGGRAVAIWTITQDDLEKSESGDYGEFRFDVEGKTSGDLNIFEEYDDNLLNLTIVSPFCSEGFIAGTSNDIIVVAYDDDDIISGTLEVWNGGVKEFNDSIENSGGAAYSYGFPNSGNVRIVVGAISRGFTLGRVSNVMVFNTSIDDVYVAACIDKPTGFETGESNRIKFEAHSSKGYVFCEGGSDPIGDITKGNLIFNWVFNDGTPDHIGDGVNPDFWDFTHVYQRAGNNSATLGIDIKSGVSTDLLGISCSV